MSRFFPHTPYAEDQPIPRTILYVHVLTRGLTTGSLLGATAIAARQLIPSSRLPTVQLLASRVLRASATGAVVGVGLSGLATVGRMWGREEIEWQDRSWRLMENRGQLRVDDFTYASIVAAPVVLALRRGTLAVGWRSLVGAVGLGSVGGMVLYMASRIVSDPNEPKEEKGKGKL